MEIRTTGMFKLMDRNIVYEGDGVGESSPIVQVMDGTMSPLPDIRTISSGFVFPLELVKEMGFDMCPQEYSGRKAVVFKWWDSGWKDKAFLGFPLEFLMNEDLGPKCPSGLMATVLNREDIENYFFNNEVLVETLRDFIGFVSITLSIEGGIKVIAVETGIPYWGFFNMLEGIKTRISEFLCGNIDFYDSWTASLLVSRFPYPFKYSNGSVFVEGLSQSVEKHFWTGVSNHRKSYTTQSTIIGIATAWSSNLNEACRRCLRTAWNVSVKDKQFRTDMVREGYRSLNMFFGEV